MVKEMKGVGPEEQVLLIGCSVAPQMCVKKDEQAFMGFFDKHIYLPLPDYASRLVCGCSDVIDFLLSQSLPGIAHVPMAHGYTAHTVLPPVITMLAVPCTSSLT